MKKEDVGTGKFNTQLLKNLCFVEGLADVIKSELKSLQNIDVLRKWEMLKASIKKYTLNFSKSQSCIKRERIADLSLSITQLEESLDTLDKCQLQNLDHQKAEAAGLNAGKGERSDLS